MGLLDGKVVVVSGVGPGLGMRIADACAREGAKVGLAARTESYLAEVAADLDSKYGAGTAVYHPTDVTDPEACEAIVAKTEDAFGKVDTIVPSAFTPDNFQPVSTVKLKSWKTMFEVNLFGGLNLAQAGIPRLRKAGGGSIVFIGSMVVRKQANLAQPGYAASKAALLSAAQSLAKELGPDGIRVNTVVPGWMDGPSVDIYLDWQTQANGTTRDEEYAKIAKDIPLGVIPPDADVANSVVFFASDLSRVITGQALDVNGGEVFH